MDHHDLNMKLASCIFHQLLRSVASLTTLRTSPTSPHTCRYSQISQSPQVKQLVNRLDAALTAMAYCVGPSCRNPWRTLHPDGAVNSLLDAMSPAYDVFYARYGGPRTSDPHWNVLVTGASPPL